MRTVRYALLVLFALAPALALAQAPDSVHVEVAGVEYPGYGARFGPLWPCLDDPFGPLPVVPTEPVDGCESLTNPDEVEGNIAFIERGECVFVQKVLTAQAAGAAGVVVYNDDSVPPGDMNLVTMGGDCPECEIPAAFVSRSSGLAILGEVPVEASVVQPRFCDPPPPPTTGVHDTGSVQFEVFDNGFLGADAEFNGTGFVFDGFDGLSVGSVLVGIDGNVVSNPYDGASEWTAVSEVESVTPPAPFDQAFQTAFENVELGIRMTERSYSRTGDPFVIVELEVENITGGDLNEVYVGIYADFDAGTTHTDDAAGVYEDLNLVYVYDPVENAPYFGVVAPISSGLSLSGYSTDATTADDAQLFEALTTTVEIAPDPADRAVVVGVGPFDIPAGSSGQAVFALVGGSDEAELLTNATFPPPPAVEETTPEGTYVLESAYPNPFAERTTISFALPTAQDVRLAVYDVLGREVVVLADGARPAGEQAVDFDASALPSGVYVVQLEAGAVRLVERVTVLR